MLESSPAFLKCYQCKRGPKEFSFLLCNHIICGKCIKKNIQISDKYNLVKCSCGCLTYFNDENQIVQMQNSGQFRTKKVNIRTKTQQNHLYETKQKKHAKKRKTFNSQDFKEKGYQSLNNQRLTIPNIEMSQIFSLQNNISSDDNNSGGQQLQSTNVLFKNRSPSLKILSHKMITTENTVCEQDSSGDITKKECKSKHINQFSTHQINENNNGQCFLGEKKPFIIPNVKNLKSSITLPGDSSIQKSPQIRKQSQQQQTQINYKRDDQIHNRFKNEINFIRILFKKDIQQVQYQFSKCLNEIKNTYHQFQNNLRSLYAEQIITNKSEIQLKLSDIIKNKYDKQIGIKFKSLKNNLIDFFHSFKHNQKLNSYPSILDPTHQTQLIKKTEQSNQTINNYSQNAYDLQNYSQAQTIKNNKVKKFSTVQEKLQRLTTQNHETKNKMSKNQFNFPNTTSMKRIQTQNIHANINSPQNINLEKENGHRANYSFDEFTPEMNCRFSQKTHKRSSPLSFEKQFENKRRQVMYFSPSMPYCYKHLKQKKSEAKNYLSFIEQLCQEKKMNNQPELFKKVKQGNQIYEFRTRD